MALKYVLLVAALVGTVIAQTERFPSSPPYHQPKVYEENMTEEEFKEMCAKNGGPDAFNNAEKAEKEFQSKEEPDETFEIYCSNDPKGNLQKLIEAYLPCFSEMERKNLNTIQGGVGKLYDFICREDNIALLSFETVSMMCSLPALFGIQECLDEFANITDTLDFKAFSRIEYWEKVCGNLSQVHECFGAALKDCQTPLRNMWDEFFEIVRKDTPCGGQVANSSPHSAHGILVPSLMLAAFAALLV